MQSQSKSCVPLGVLSQYHPYRKKTKTPKNFFGGHTHLVVIMACSWFWVKGSFLVVVRGPFGVGCQGLNLGQLHGRQVPYPLKDISLWPLKLLYSFTATCLLRFSQSNTSVFYINWKTIFLILLPKKSLTVISTIIYWRK